MTTTRHLGLDLGGTNIKAAVLEHDTKRLAPELIHDESVPTEAALGPDHVARRLVQIGRKVMSKVDGITTLGLGVPGLFDIDTGTIEMFPNLAGEWEGYALRDRVGSDLGLPTSIINDARAFTLTVNRDLIREAVFFFKTPFCTDLSRALTVGPNRSCAPLLSLLSSAVCSFLTSVRMRLLLRVFSAERFAICRIFLIAEGVFAI